MIRIGKRLLIQRKHKSDNLIANNLTKQQSINHRPVINIRISNSLRAFRFSFVELSYLDYLLFRTFTPTLPIFALTLGVKLYTT